MKSQVKERWEVLCEQAVKEQDPGRFLKLIREINELLKEKQLSLGAKKFSAKAGR